ncbi:MAG: hypothetical protein J6Y93_06015 [Treponema sp.]|nr:hypothetical protein [Treponema sp.]
MVGITPSGSGTGPVSTPLTFPEGTIVASFGSGCYCTTSSGLKFYGCPLNASLLFAINNHVEVSASGAFFITKEGTEEKDEPHVRSLSGSIKFMFDARVSKNAALNFGANFRIGGSNAGLFPPYGADYMNGLGCGLMTGISFGSSLANYIGVSGEYIYRPIEGPSEDGATGTLKCGIAIIKRMEDFGTSLYGAFESCHGTYECIKHRNGAEHVITTDLTQNFRVYDAGFSVICYPGESSMQIGFNAGFLFYPEEETYVYAKLNFSWLF